MPTRSDPTRTVTLRRQFEIEMRKRFKLIKKAIVNLVVDLDVFGLEVGAPFIFNVERQQFRFQTDAAKVDSFRKWLGAQIDAEVLTTVGVAGEPFTATFIDSAYRKGTVRAFTDSRAAALSQKSEFFEGTKAEFLRSAFAAPERLSKIQLLATRAFEELRGVTATMSQQLNRVLATGLASGDSPIKIARAMTAQVGKLTKTRAVMIARTEIVAAHAEGQLDTFADLGIDEVGILAEWSTAGDDRVCPMCEPLDGAIMTIKEARGLIPRHPNCRCAWIPSTMAEQKNRRKKNAKAFRESKAAEANKTPKAKKKNAEFRKRLKKAKEEKKARAKRKRKKKRR